MHEPDPIRTDDLVSRRAALGRGLAVLGLGAAAAVGLDACTSAGSTGAPPSSSRPASRTTSTAPATTAARSTPASPGSSARMVSGRFVSAKRGGLQTGWTIAYPAGRPAGPLPVLIALHGKGGDHSAPFTELHLDEYLTEQIAHGTPPFAIAGVDGGHGRYWHPRRADDGAGMVIEEFLPLLAEHGLDTSRIALFGWSMGGYGALYLASVLGRSRVASVGVESPAIWQQYDEGVPGAFDDAADFAAHSIFGRLKELDGIPTRIDSGAQEEYAAAIAYLRAHLRPPPAGQTEPGGHNVTLWLSKAPAQIAFAGAHLHA